MIKVRTVVIDNYFEVMTEVDVDDYLFRKVCEPLDLPSPNAPAYVRMLCTRPSIIKMAMNDRQVLAKGISEAITQQLLEYMEAQDTIMGYKIAKRNAK